MKALQLQAARTRFLASGKTRLDWVHYLSEVDRIRQG